MNYQEIPLTNNKAGHKFEMVINGSLAFIAYRQKGDSVYLVHTEVPPEQQGRGIAAVLVEKTLQYIDGHHLTLVPLCSYVQHYLRQHPQWEHLVS